MWRLSIAMKKSTLRRKQSAQPRVSNLLLLLVLPSSLASCASFSVRKILFAKGIAVFACSSVLVNESYLEGEGILDLSTAFSVDVDNRAFTWW